MPSPDTHHNSIEDSMDTRTVLIIFVEIAIFVVYLVSLLLVVVRRAKRLIELRNRKYYITIAFYISTKLMLCALLIVSIVAGISDQWQNLDSADVELVIKTAFILADFAIIELFLISLQTYLILSLSVLNDEPIQQKAKILTRWLKSLQLGVIFILLVPLIFFNLNLLHYRVINVIALSLNSFIVVAFCATVFYLNFKMTGIMIDNRLSTVLKRIYKVQLIILLSRVFVIIFEVLIIDLAPDTFQAYIDQISQTVDYEVILGLVFLTSIIFTLLTEGLPMMYSMRSSVVTALNFKQNSGEPKDTLLSENCNDLEQSMVQHSQSQTEERHELRLKHFQDLVDLQSNNQNAIWTYKKGKLDGKQYLLRICRHQISSFIFEDVRNQMAYSNQLALPSLPKLTYFSENNLLHFVQKYLPVSLDQRADSIESQTEQLKLALQIAEAISEMHHKDVALGCLSPQHIFLDDSQIIFNNYGFESLKKYLSLLTGYTNKTIYTATEHLKENSKVVLRPKKTADIYSFGVILYEIVTKNKQYRQLPLKQVQTKFANQNFRPKLPTHTKTELKTLIRKCWHQNPDGRPSITEVIDSLRQQI